jgi:hypothetical protein
MIYEGRDPNEYENEECMGMGKYAHTKQSIIYAAV